MRVYENPQDLLADRGNEIGVSQWRLITQDMINAFADVTKDHQWIHVDEKRAAREAPHGKTIAHGYLVLSLGPSMMDEVFQVTNISQGLNYGSNKIRFVAPTPTDSFICARIAFGDIHDRGDDNLLVSINLTMEIQGSQRPAFVQEMLGLYCFDSEAVRG